MISRKRWEAGTSAGEMIRSALHWVKNPKRKGMLYRIALVRRVWDELPWLCQTLTDLAEREVDGQFDPSLLAAPLEHIAEGASLCIQFSLDREASNEFPSYCFADYERYLLNAEFTKPLDADRAIEQTPLPRLYELTWLAYGVHFMDDKPRDISAKSAFDSIPILRDIFGNPFKRPNFKGAWRTDTAVTLARGMYESRDFSAMPILADALQDAGCDNDDILTHCRDADVPHVRGCWVADLVLGKE
ncbi:hypothetical protein VT84_05000 [Gemmata sp. SH-PL17]|uniref:hypothetical protein n=1 Tax=Gemmata sp. SH-PL17 TaxID=1630693 RepID=UPI00078CC78D|nr:hypothetical protein [Gemmata sp. SH-PL17]AMV23748.1 hypothetical protein VT84_05000 [Gemmata sp. SH-PL17]